MNTPEIRRELHELIEREDTSTLEGIYGIITNYISHREECRMIDEAEEDIKADRVLSHEEVTKIIYSWKK